MDIKEFEKVCLNQEHKSNGLNQLKDA